jgi:hypothetical protein
MSRVPGEFASSDATFKVAGRVGNPDYKALYFILGENADVQTFGAIRSESADEVLNLQKAFAKRLERKGVLHQLKYWWDDRCCNGATDVRGHVLTTIFPGLERAPFKDKFHAVQLITSSVSSTHHDLYVPFASAVGKLFAAPHEPDILVAMKASLRAKKTTTSQARQHVMASNKASIRTQGRDPQTLLRELNHLKDHWGARVDASNRPLFRPHKEAWTTKGTADQIDCVATCASKGCLTDPVSVERMYNRVHLSKHGMPHYSKKSESARNEGLHRIINRLVEGISYSTAENFEPRLLLRLYRQVRSTIVTLALLNF